MYGDYNKVIMVGTVVNTPELRKTDAGLEVTNFTIREIEPYKDRTTGEHKHNTKYHKIVCWGDKAIKATNILKANNIVRLEGSLCYHQYDRHNTGNPETISEIRADVIVRIGYRRKRDENQKNNNNTVVNKNDEIGGDDIIESVNEEVAA